jgi:hypothetical protein
MSRVVTNNTTSAQSNGEKFSIRSELFITVVTKIADPAALFVSHTLLPVEVFYCLCYFGFGLVYSFLLSVVLPNW